MGSCRSLSDSGHIQSLEVFIRACYSALIVIQPAGRYYHVIITINIKQLTITGTLFVPYLWFPIGESAGGEGSGGGLGVADIVFEEQVVGAS